MVDQPRVHHLSRRLPDDVVLHKVLVLVHPRLHARVLRIVDGRRGRVPVVMMVVVVVTVMVAVVMVCRCRGRGVALLRRR